MSGRGVWLKEECRDTSRPEALSGLAVDGDDIADEHEEVECFSREGLRRKDRRGCKLPVIKNIVVVRHIVVDFDRQQRGLGRAGQGRAKYCNYGCRKSFHFELLFR